MLGDRWSASVRNRKRRMFAFIGWDLRLVAKARPLGECFFVPSRVVQKAFSFHA